MTLRQDHRQYRLLIVVALLLLGGGFAAAQTAERELVEIAVEITEINTSKARELGIRWTDTILSGETGIAQSGRVPEVLPDVPSIVEAGSWERYTLLTAELKMLQEKGAAQVLSKPKLVTRSGTSARFLVGGEFPVVAAGVTGGSVDWKEYGIMTEILPRVLADGLIDITLTTEVSRLDWANKVQGYPAISSREATANVRLKTGQSLALAGMLETKKEEKRAGIPLLSDIPVLGYLFARKDMVESQTNVVIFITPRILE